MPPHIEPWGVVVNEALAAGCPVIATDTIGAAEDLVVDGVNGRIIQPRNPALAAALTAPRLPGDHSRGRIERWDNEFGAEQFLEALQLALPGRLTKV